MPAEFRFELCDQLPGERSLTFVRDDNAVDCAVIWLSVLSAMKLWRILVPVLLICWSAFAFESRLPFKTIFKGQDQFNRLVAQAKEHNWKSLPIGERTAAVGQALTGTRYKSYTLEIDNRIESPSVNFTGLDCWTFFETSLAFARMLNEPEENWSPQNFLHYIEVDRYRDG